MTIGTVPIRDRMVLTDGGPLAANLQAETIFPIGSTAFLHIYDASGAELVFWPVNVEGDTLEILIETEDLDPIRADARMFRIYVIYPTHARQWPWYEGPVVRSH